MSPPPGQEKWRQGSGGPQESTSSFSQRSSPALFPLLQPWPFLQVQDGVGEKREIHLTSKPDFEVPPSLHRGTFLYGTPTMYVDILNQPDFSSYDISAMSAGGMGPRVARPGLA